MAEWLNWTFWTESFIGSAHFICALGALLLAPIMMVRRKGDRSHKWLGRIWAAMMAVIIISAFSMYELKGRPNLFHFFALVSLVTLSSAIWAIRKYKKTRERKYLVTHQHCMVWAYFGLTAAGVWQIVFTLVRTGQLNLSIGMLYNGLGVLTAFASVGLFLYLRKKYPDAPKP